MKLKKVIFTEEPKKSRDMLFPSRMQRFEGHVSSHVKSIFLFETSIPSWFVLFKTELTELGTTNLILQISTEQDGSFIPRLQFLIAFFNWRTVSIHIDPGFGLGVVDGEGGVAGNTTPDTLSVLRSLFW
jgi:hypothetical protein